MLIRAEQLNHLDATGMEQHLAQHLPGFAPVRIQSLSKPSLTMFVRTARLRAATFGWMSRGPVEFFAEAMVMLGSDFATDPQFSWAATALRSSTDEMEAADRLHGLMMTYYDRVVGPGQDHEIEAIKRLLASPWFQEQQTRDSSPSQISMLLEDIFPEKYNLVAKSAIDALLERAKRLCALYSVPSTELSVVTTILFCFGHGAFEDPQHPWIVAALEPGNFKNHAGLRVALKIHLEETLIGLEQEWQ